MPHNRHHSMYSIPVVQQQMNPVLVQQMNPVLQQQMNPVLQQQMNPVLQQQMNPVLQQQMNPVLQQVQSLRRQSHSTCVNITRVGIIFYNSEGILFIKNEKSNYMQPNYMQSNYMQPNYMQPNFIRSNFTQYMIPLEPKMYDESEEDACKRIFSEKVGVILQTTQDKGVGTPYKRRHRNGLCSTIYVIETTQDIKPVPDGFAFLTYKEVEELIRKSDDRKLIDYKLFSDLINEKKLTESRNLNISSDKEIREAIKLLFDYGSDADLDKLVKEFASFKGGFDDTAPKAILRSTTMSAELDKALDVLKIKINHFLNYKSNSIPLDSIITEAIK